MKTHKTIYADFNDFDASGMLPLTSAGSRASIAALDGALEDGEEVRLTDGELSAFGRILRRQDGSWEATLLGGFDSAPLRESDGAARGQEEPEQGDPGRD